MLCLLDHLLLFLLLNGITHGRRTISGQVPRFPATAGFNFSTASHLTQGSSNSHVTSSASGLYNASQGVANINDPMPTLENPKSAINHQDVRSGFCAIGDAFCSFKEKNGTMIKAPPTNFSDQCLLWDHSCTGNRTLAIQQFFNVAFADADVDGDDIDENGKLIDNDCFLQNNGVNQSDCNKYNPPQRLSDFAKIKDWMRSQECVAAADEWMAMTGNSWQVIFGGRRMPDLGAIAQNANSNDNPDSNSPSCCGTCNVFAQNVDLYYWLEPDANLSCLNIIGKSSNLPLDYGATTVTDVGSTQLYWGCTTTSTGTIMGEPGVSTTVTSIVTTAAISTIGPLSVKVSSISPWSSAPCNGDDIGSQPSNRSINGLEKRASIYGREHSLFVPSAITQADGLPVSTLVSGDFTFTSPSVYAYFHGMSIYDNCGQSVMSPTMLSFSKGELSTIDGHLGYLQTDPFGTGQSSKLFNLGDLPCPPQSVMEANWYKPRPGEPYRPLIAMPSQLKRINPWFSFCEGGLFTAYDPPSVLDPASALAPPISSSDPKPHAPVPSPTLDPGDGHKGGSELSPVVPANIATLDQPKATNNIATAPPRQNGPNPGSQANDAATQESPPPQPRPNTGKPNGDPQDIDNSQHGSDPKQSSDPKEGNDPSDPSDPKQGSNPKAGNDPNKVSDPKQGNDPNKANDPKQVNGNNIQSAQESDRESNSDPHRVNSVPPNDPNQADDTNPFNGIGQGQVKTINNQVVQPLSHGISIAGTTLTPGAPPITVSGTSIHLGSSALVIGTSTVPFSRNTGPITTTIAGHVIEASSDAIIVAGTTLTRGSPPMTVSGTPIYFGPSALVVGTSTVPLALEPLPQMTTTIGGQAITAAPSIVTIAGTTLAPGAPGVSLDGTLLSLNTASQLIVGSKTISLQSASLDPITTTIGGHTITAAPDKISIGGNTLTPGAPHVTIDGTLVSLNTAAQLIIGSKTIALQSGTAGPGELTAGEGFRADTPSSSSITTTLGNGQVFTAGPTALTVAGTTLTPGAPGITVDGTLLSLRTDSQLVVGSKTVSLADDKADSSARQTAGLGDLIMGGLFGSGGPFGPFAKEDSPPRSTQSNGSITATKNSSSTDVGVQAFAGEAAELRITLLLRNNAVSLLLVIGMIGRAYLC